MGAHAPLAQFAERQHGVVSIRQLLGPLGYTRSAVEHAVAVGRLYSVRRGVYAVGRRQIPLEGRCLAAVLTCGPRALLSHLSAAWLWGLRKGSPEPFAVTAPSPRRPRPPITLHYARNLLPQDRALVETIPVTAVPRTLLDCAAVVSADRLARMLERAEERRLFDLGPVEELLGRTVGHPGSGRLRRALTLYREPTLTRSELERQFVAAVERVGLPRPATNFNEEGYELDVYWKRERFAVELDVYETHGSRAAFERDRYRQGELKLAGIEMDRVTGYRFEREPLQVVARVARLLAQRRAQLGL